MKKARAHNINLCLYFIDYSKAFDCTMYDQLWLSMQRLGFSDHLIGLIETLYRDQQSTIRTPCGLTDSFHNAKGVRQGCILSPYLINIYSECIMREAIMEKDGICFGGRKTANLRYADDTALIETAADRLQHLIDKVAALSEEKGLLLNKKLKSWASAKTLKLS